MIIIKILMVILIIIIKIITTIYLKPDRLVCMVIGVLARAILERGNAYSKTGCIK